MSMSNSNSELKPYWYCEECCEEVDGSCVTFQELHDRCGHPVIWIEPRNTRKDKE